MNVSLNMPCNVMTCSVCSLVQDETNRIQINGEGVHQCREHFETLGISVKERDRERHKVQYSKPTTPPRRVQ